jgi:DnaD/phage-associated family protein
MAWIESHQELAEHPKTKKLMRLLGAGRPQAIGYLHLLWWWALDYAQDGSLARYEPADIAEAAGWQGEASKFVSALLDCGSGGSKGFLERDPAGTLLIHDWDDYAGKLLDQRRANAERARKSRERRQHAAGNVRASCTATIPTVPDTTVHNQPDTTAPPPVLSRHVAQDGVSEPASSVVPTAKRAARRASGDSTNTLSPQAEKPTEDELADWAIAVEFAGKNLGTTGMLRPTELDKLRDWHKRGLASGCLIRAMQEAIDHGAPNWAYIGKICEKWIEAKVTQVEDIEPLERDHEYRKKKDKQAQQRDSGVFAPMSDEDKRKVDDITKQLAERLDMNKAVRE